MLIGAVSRGALRSIAALSAGALAAAGLTAVTIVATAAPAAAAPLDSCTLAGGVPSATSTPGEVRCTFSTPGTYSLLLPAATPLGVVAEGAAGGGFIGTPIDGPDGLPYLPAGKGARVSGQFSVSAAPAFLTIAVGERGAMAGDQAGDRPTAGRPGGGAGGIGDPSALPIRGTADRETGFAPAAGGGGGGLSSVAIDDVPLVVAGAGGGSGWNRKGLPSVSVGGNAGSSGGSGLTYFWDEIGNVEKGSVSSGGGTAAYVGGRGGAAGGAGAGGAGGSAGTQSPDLCEAYLAVSSADATAFVVGDEGAGGVSLIGGAAGEFAGGGGGAGWYGGGAGGGGAGCRLVPNEGSSLPSDFVGEFGFGDAGGGGGGSSYVAPSASTFAITDGAAAPVLLDGSVSVTYRPGGAVADGCTAADAQGEVSCVFVTPIRHTLALPETAVDVRVTAYGAQGGDVEQAAQGPIDPGFAGGTPSTAAPFIPTVPGGRGARIDADLTGAAGTTLTIEVGQRGGTGGYTRDLLDALGNYSLPVGGFPDGGDGGQSSATPDVSSVGGGESYFGAGGGGSTRIRVGTTALVQAGGGGGAGYAPAGTLGRGGDTGSAGGSGSAPEGGSGGGAGAPVATGFGAGGAGGTGTCDVSLGGLQNGLAGSAAVVRAGAGGGTPTSEGSPGGGGGGGFRGGGGGGQASFCDSEASGGGGGGGGSRVDASVTSSTIGIAPRGTVQNGNGLVLLRYRISTGEAPQITEQPTDKLTGDGQNSFFEASATGIPAPVVSWERSTDGGATFLPVPRGSIGDQIRYTDFALIITGATKSMDGDKFRATFTNSAGTATTRIATLLVDSPPVITQSPQDLTIEEGQVASFSAAATGDPAPTVQWYESIAGGPFALIPGATGTELVLGQAHLGMSGDRYFASFTNEDGVQSSSIATLTVTIATSAPVITQQPPPGVIAEAGQPGTFITASATGVPTPTTIWQVSTDGGASWTDVPVGTPADDVFTTSDAIIIRTPSIDLDGNLYRAVFTNSRGSVTSSAAELLIYTDPVVTLDPVDASVVEGEPATFTAAATGNPTPEVQWYRSDDDGLTFQIVPGATTGELTLPAAQLSDDGAVFKALFSTPVGTAWTASAVLDVRVATSPPAITSQDQALFRVGFLYALYLEATGKPTPAISVTGTLPAGITFQDAGDGTGVLGGIPDAGSGGVYTLQVRASNGIGSDALQQFTLVIEEAPTVAVASPLAWTSGTASSTPITTAGYPAPSIQISGFPAWVSVTTVNGVLRLGGTPPVGTGGTFSGTVTASNPAGSDSTTVRIDVSDAARFTSGAAASFTIGTAGSASVTTSGTPTAAITATGLPAWLSLTDAGDGTATLTGTPPAGSSGQTTFTLRASNGVGTAAQQTFTLNVAKRTAVLTYTGATSGAFSDAAALSATLVDSVTGAPITGAAVTFTVGTQSVTTTTSTLAPAGIASSSLVITQGAGQVARTAQFAGNATYSPVSSSSTFTVQREAAVVRPATTNVRSVAASTTRNGTVVPSLTIGATVREVADGSIGDITKVGRVDILLVPLSGGTARSCSVTPTSAGTTWSFVSSSQTLTVSCAIPNVGVDVYDVVLRVGPNAFYEGEVHDGLLVFDPAATGARGAGTITGSAGGALPAGTTATYTFDFTSKKAGGAQGKVLYVVSTTVNGVVTQKVFKGTSLASIAVRTTTSPKTVTVTGKGVLEGVGNYGFSLNASDAGATGDRFSILVTAPSGAPAVPSVFNLPALTLVDAGSAVVIL